MSKKNIKELDSSSQIINFIKSLKVISFNFDKVVDKPYTPASKDEFGRTIPEQKETYIPLPSGLQVTIEPSSIEPLYPEALTKDALDNKTYRPDILTAMLVQAVKELTERIEILEAKK